MKPTIDRAFPFASPRFRSELHAPGLCRACSTLAAICCRRATRGQLTIQLHDHAEKFTAAAWRDKSGVIHLIPSGDKLVEQSLTEIAGVRDAHCLTMAASAKTSRHAWLIRQDRSLHVSEAIQNAIASVPRTLQPDYVHAISEFPLTAAGRIDSAKLHRSLTDVKDEDFA
jgi:hypothetical protein